jgi:predicted small lipoprotein YifL
MKTISQLLLLVIAVASLTACDSTKGPSKPAETTSLHAALK